MDAIQFGRWLHKRRRAYGFSSQRTLVERVQQEPSLRHQNISEAFLARLETGQLVHPFRGGVRQRVLALAEILCSTPNDINTYLRAAEIKELDSTETHFIARLRARLSQPQERILHLPVRHQPIFGREEIKEKLLSTLCHTDTHLVLITGMAGVGKSTLAAEVVHCCSEGPWNDAQKFRNGIISFSCTGYQGNKGLLALCDHILAMPGNHLAQFSRGKDQKKQQEVDLDQVLNVDDATLSRAMNQVRLALADRSLLFLLDDLDAHFPLRQALEMLGSQKYETTHTLLVTSRYHFASFAHAHHVHLEALSPQAALDNLTFLLGRSLDKKEQAAAKDLCALVGYLPLALGALATLYEAGISLPLLHETLAVRSLASLMEYDEELYARIKSAFAALSKEQQQLFSLLALVDVPSLGIEAISALCATPETTDTTSQFWRTGNQPSYTNMVLEIGKLKQYSLLNLQAASRENALQARYQLHPILRAYGRHMAAELPQKRVVAAKENIRNYALSYIEQHGGDIRRLLAERDLLFACCTEALQAERYSDVMQFVTGLAPISCRMNTRKEGSALFHWGMQASQQLHDQAQHIRFMHYYGWLCFQRGAFEEARQVWLEALAKTENSSLHYWQPLLSLAQLARLQHAEHEAEQYVERYLFAARDNALTQSYAYAHILLALYQRLQHKKDAAYRTLDKATQLLASSSPAQQPDLHYFNQKLLTIEQARVLEIYAQAQEETEILATILEQKEEHYNVADLLLEQAAFAQRQQKWEYIPSMAHRSIQAAARVDATYLHALSTQMAQEATQVISLRLQPYKVVDRLG